MKVVIIEDEPSPREELIRLLGKINPNIQVIDTFETVSESIAWFQKGIPVDLVFMDIQLADGLSFEIFQKVSIKSPIIFTTAFNEHALAAFKVNSIEYLLKPLDEKSLNKALEKFENFKHQFNASNKPLPDNTFDLQTTEGIAKISALIQTYSQPKFRSRFLVFIGDRVKHISTEEISYFLAEDNVVFITCKSSDRYIADLSIEQISAELDPTIFFRINRGIISNISSIKDVRKHFNGRLKIFLEPLPPKGECFVSRQRVQDFLDWMGR